jgi:hypothetical protein
VEKLGPESSIRGDNEEPEDDEKEPAGALTCV